MICFLTCVRCPLYLMVTTPPEDCFPTSFVQDQVLSLNITILLLACFLCLWQLLSLPGNTGALLCMCGLQDFWRSVYYKADTTKSLFGFQLTQFIRQVEGQWGTGDPSAWLGTLPPPSMSDIITLEGLQWATQGDYDQKSHST